VKYLGERDRTRYKPDEQTGESTDGRAQAPPALIREGEKVQPDWLFRFLKNPFEIRPVTVLRMPRFNMSDEEAMALVNYFASVDKVNNPAAGVIYPYVAIPQRDEEYFRKMSIEYVDRLKKSKVPPDLVEPLKKQKLFAEGDTMYSVRVKELEPIWKQAYQEQLKDLEGKLKTARARAEKPKPEEKEGVEKAVKDLEQEIATLKKKGYQALQSLWEEKEAYVADGY